jgi:hypothetical protein
LRALVFGAVIAGGIASSAHGQQTNDVWVTLDIPSAYIVTQEHERTALGFVCSEDSGAIVNYNFSAGAGSPLARGDLVTVTLTLPDQSTYTIRGPVTANQFIGGWDVDGNDSDAHRIASAISPASSKSKTVVYAVGEAGTGPGTMRLTDLEAQMGLESGTLLSYSEFTSKGSTAALKPFFARCRM